MAGWDGFWIALAIGFAAEEFIEYLKWRTKIEYGLKEKKKKWWQRF